MDFKTLLKNEFVYLDGAMGTVLQARGLEMGGIPEVLNIEKPEWLKDIHKQYIEAGADIIYANTFGANRCKLAGCGFGVSEIIEAAVENAKAARGKKTFLLRLI